MGRKTEKSIYMRMYYLDESKIEKMPAEIFKNIVLGVMHLHNTGEEVTFQDNWTQYEYELLKERTLKDEKEWMEAKAKHAEIVAQGRERKKNAVESHETHKDDKVISEDIKVVEIKEKQPLSELQDITPQSKIVNDNPIIENSVYKKVYGRAFARNKDGNIYPLEEDRLKTVFEELTDNIYQDAFKNIKSRMNNKTFDYVSANYGNFNFMYS